MVLGKSLPCGQSEAGRGGVGVGDWEDCEGSGRTQGSVARELDLYLGSTYVNVRQSLSQLQLTQLQDKVISVTSTGYEEH